MIWPSVWPLLQEASTAAMTDSETVRVKELASRQDKIRLVGEDFVESRIQAGSGALA